MISYPKISPDIFRIGDFAIRWYSVMYLLGYLIGFKIFKIRQQQGLFRVSKEGLDNFISYLVVGMLVGARLFYVIFYNYQFYIDNPGELLMIWHGGLSFHGALAGMVTAAWIFGKKYKVGFFEVTDAMALACGPGIFLGRIGNFINGELYGRASDVPWAMVFPPDNLQVPRHPSQLYQGLGEGLAIWAVLLVIDRYMIKRNSYKFGILGPSFLIGYGIVRFFIEFTREPDAQLGFFFRWITMGQMLCFAMIAIGIIILLKTRKHQIVKLKK